jgi:Carboxypeptidase regulatory-like domain
MKTLRSLSTKLSLLLVTVSVLTALALCPNARAQSGSITGQILDGSSSAVAGATVDALNNATGVVRSDTTNTQGYFTISALPQGDYTLTARATGFSNVQRTGVRLDQSQNLRVDLALAVGVVETRVEVNSQAPALERE